MLERTRQEVVALNRALPQHGLVTWTSGNVSVRDTASGLVVIKPSGLHFDALTPEDMVVVDLDGRVIEGRRTPSSDTASHLYLYRHRPEIHGIVHTHSAYATAFAALGRPIPVYLTAQADEFGGPIPCAGFALIGGEQIGQAVLESIGASPAVLLKNHGVFAVGPTGEAALKAAVMVEDIARTTWLALQLGQPDEIPQAQIDQLHQRYRGAYGQR